MTTSLPSLGFLMARPNGYGLQGSLEETYRLLDSGWHVVPSNVVLGGAGGNTYIVVPATA
jgi:hypothetical protein